MALFLSYMIDAADREKIEASRNELHNLLDKPQLQGIPVSLRSLIFYICNYIFNIEPISVSLEIGFKIPYFPQVWRSEDLCYFSFPSPLPFILRLSFITWDLWSCCFSLPSVGIIGVCHHTWLLTSFVENGVVFTCKQHNSSMYFELYLDY